MTRLLITSRHRNDSSDEGRIETASDYSTPSARDSIMDEAEMFCRRDGRVVEVWQRIARFFPSCVERIDDSNDLPPGAP